MRSVYTTRHENLGRNLLLAAPVLASALLLACVQPETTAGTEDAVTDVDPSEEDIGEAADAITGSYPLITIGCKFPDVASPGPISSFGDLISKDTYPGISHYFRSVSGNKLNLVGSKSVADWITLPYPKAHYYWPNTQELDTNAIAVDCLPLADAQVHYPSFKGVNLVHNGGGTNWGGGRQLSFDGVTKNYGWTVFTYGMITDAGAIVHEVGHVIGLRHVPVTGVNCGNVYSNVFDPMSTHAYNNWLSPGGNYPAYFGVVSRMLQGWIGAGRVVTVAAGVTKTVDLARADAASGTLVVKAPFSSTSYFTVEARRKDGTNAFDGSTTYEQALPHEGAVITVAVPQSGYWEPWMIDGDNNCDTVADQGTVWTPGETFDDAGKGTTVKVLSKTANGYKVEVTAPGQLTLRPVLGKITLSVTGTSDRTCSSESCVYPVSPLKSLTLKATPNEPGSTFDGWVNCPNPSGTTCTLVPTAAGTVWAMFSPPSAGPCDDCHKECELEYSPGYCSSLCDPYCP